MKKDSQNDLPDQYSELHFPLDFRAEMRNKLQSPERHEKPLKVWGIGNGCLRRPIN
jgi:hypothetical protein